MRRAVVRERRISNAADAHWLLLFKVSEHRFRAFHVVVMCLISDELWEMFILSENGHLIHLPHDREISPPPLRYSCTVVASCYSFHGQSTPQPLFPETMYMSFVRFINAGSSHRCALHPASWTWLRAAGVRSRTDTFPSNVCTSTARTSSSTTAKDRMPIYRAWSNSRS